MIVAHGAYNETRENLETLFNVARDNSQQYNSFCIEEHMNGTFCFSGGRQPQAGLSRFLDYEGIKSDRIGRPKVGPAFSKTPSIAKGIGCTLEWEVLTHFDATSLPLGRYRLEGSFDYCLYGEVVDNPWGAEAHIRADTGGDQIFQPRSLMVEKDYSGPWDQWLGDSISGFCEFELAELLALHGYGVKLGFWVAGGQHVQFIEARYQLSRL